jgi:ubiquinone/menaquinone biosynthesis C-methylase UbiE
LEIIQPFVKKSYGVDPGIEAIKTAKKRLPTSIFRVEEAQMLSFKRNTFDTVFLLEVLEHVPVGTEAQVISEIARVLKKNGTLILSTPHNNIFSILGDPAYFLIGHRHYSLQSINRLLFMNGFSIIKTYQTGGFVRIATVNIELLAKHLLRRSIKWPSFIHKIIASEYKNGGFFENHVVAKKLSR